MAYEMHGGLEGGDDGGTGVFEGVGGGAEDSVFER